MLTGKEKAWNNKTYSKWTMVLFLNITDGFRNGLFWIYIINCGLDYWRYTMIPRHQKEMAVSWQHIFKGTFTGDIVILRKVSQDSKGVIMDYIILYELCHLIIKEYSYNYWDLVHKYMPNYEQKIYWLNVWMWMQYLLWCNSLTWCHIDR